MESMIVLEEKLQQLVGFISDLKAQNALLKNENSILVEQMKSLEASMLKENKSIEMLQEEKEMTKLVVDSLIKSIDSLVSVQK